MFLVRKPPPASTAPEEHPVGDPATTRSIIRQGTVTDAFADGKEAIVVDAILTNVAVISQSCDIDRKAFLAVATVIPIISIANRDKEDSVRASKMGGTYWLPEQPGILLESYIDLSLIFSVRRENLVARIGDRILGLSILAGVFPFGPIQPIDDALDKYLCARQTNSPYCPLLLRAKAPRDRGSCFLVGDCNGIDMLALERIETLERKEIKNGN